MQTSGPVHTDPSRDDHVWVVRVLGSLEVRVGSASVTLGGPQQRLVLALLIADAGRLVTTERLIADVWPEDPPERARKTIQVYVSNLRRQLGGTDGLLRATGTRSACGWVRPTTTSRTRRRSARSASGWRS